MIKEEVLRTLLIAIANDLKSQSMILGMLGRELSALRETVRDLDPTFSETLRSWQDHLKSQADQTGDALADEYDGWIVKLRSDDIFS
jgi:hypothetical protein